MSMQIKTSALLGLSLIFLGGACEISGLDNLNHTNVLVPVDTVELQDVSFAPDAGIRMEDASNPGVKFNSDGSMSLLFENRTGAPGNAVATAKETSDWLEFGNSETGVNVDFFRAVQLPDGTWRAYGFDTTKGIEGTCLTSQSSADGVNFNPDDGCRYQLQPEDEGRMGVYDVFSDSSGGVVLLYIGDLYGRNNVRRAYSTDNGWTFSFDSGNVFGDDAAGGGAKSYVDQKTVVLPDESVYVVAMQMGSIYGFISTDGGQTFTLQGKIVTPSDFSGFDIHSLHDPQIIQLPDGRLRIYVAGAQGTPDQAKWLILSTTSDPVI